MFSVRVQRDDGRLVMSVPKDGVLPITINQRYVLSALHHGRQVVGLMLPKGIRIPTARRATMPNGGNHVWSFKTWRDEASEEVPDFGYFEVVDPHALLALRDDWLFAVMRETERAWKLSGYRRFHVHAFHQAVVDKGYRNHLLDSVFNES